MRKLSEARKKAIHKFYRNRALLGLFMRHPDKMNDEKAVEIVKTLAREAADARITLAETPKHEQS